MAYQGDKAVTLPNFYPTPGQALQGVIHQQRQDQQRQYEIDYRQQKEREADEWKKMNLIQDLTDISAYKTGEAVADGLANNLMSSVFQKYTNAAAQMSPAELQAGIQKDMKNIITGVGGLKSELAEADKQFSTLKTLYPELDIAKLYDVYRKEVVDRHLTNNGTDFKNPMEVGQPRLNLNDPAFLSRFITGNKNLREAVINPKGTDPTDVFVGTPDAYTKFTGRMTPWMKPNYDPEAVKEGFLPKGAKDPRLELRGEDVPLPAAEKSGQPFRVVPTDVYDLFRGDAKHHMEVIAGARQMFPEYDSLPPESKQLAERKFLYDFIKSNDRSDFHPTHVNAAPRTNIRVNAGGSSSKEVTINDVWGELINATTNPTYKPSSFGSEPAHTPVSELPEEAKDVVLKYARNWMGNNYLTQEDIGVRQEGDRIVIVDAATGKSHGSLDKKGVNIKTQTGKNTKDEVVKQDKKSTAPATKKYKGLDEDGNPIFE